MPALSAEREPLFFEEGEMEMLGNLSWRWGLSLIVLTMTIHAAAVVMMAFAGVRMRAQLEKRSLICGT